MDLQSIARHVRRQVLEMVWEAESGHLGGSFSAAEILTVLYFSEMKLDPIRPGWPGRDRFVLSKGHAAPALYALLAQKGYLPEGELRTLRKLNSRLQGHPDMNKTPGVDMSSGSLGQGLSAAIGMALASRVQNQPYRVYVLMGDGELQEGQVWEGAMAAARFSLDNLVAICDLNGVQLDGFVNDIMPVEPVTDKWRSFGWATVEADGHDPESLLRAFHAARQTTGRPTVILARTVKGRGVSFMENNHAWHGKPLSRGEYEQAAAELGMAASREGA